MAFSIGRRKAIIVFKVLVKVFDHDDRRVHHCPDGNGNARKGHDIGVDSLELHNGEGNEYCRWERENRDQRASGVQKKNYANERNDNYFFNKLITQVVDCPKYQV